MKKTRTLFIVKNRALGDSVMGLSSLQYLKSIYPKANIIYAVPQWVAPLYKNTTIAADEVYPLSIHSIQDIFKLFFYLKKKKVDHIHEMHQTGRGQKVFKFLSIILGISYSAHNHHIKVKTGVRDQGIIKPLIQRDLDGVYSFLGQQDFVPNYINFSPKIAMINRHIKKKRVILGVVATRKTKMWPLEYYLKLAKMIIESYSAVEVVIPLAKSADDQKIKLELERIGLFAGLSIVQIPLDELVKYFSESSFYVGNDTGLKHIAVATEIKTFTLFGPEPANEWHPYDDKQHPYFYRENLSCRTRNHHYCGLSECDLEKQDSMQCLNFFTPEIVFKEIESTCKDFFQ